MQLSWKKKLKNCPGIHFRNNITHIVHLLSNLEQKILTKFLNDKNNEEISNELNLSKKSIENALFRIRNKLKYLNK